MINKYASAYWVGDFKDGMGHISSESGALHDTPYAYTHRFEDTAGSNPEELIAASHAACFSMALSLMLSKADMTANDISTKATVSLEKDGDGFSITKSHLEVTVRLAGGDADAIKKCAEQAKDGCPISKVLTAEISMDLTVDT